MSNSFSRPKSLRELEKRTPDPHLNLLLWVSFHNGVVREEYLGTNFDIMAKKLLTASFDSGGLASLMALTFSGFGFKPF